MKIITHCTASPEEVRKFYLEENHSLKDTAIKFNCKVDALNGFLEKNHIEKKKSTSKTFLRARKEEVVDYYIIKNHTETETALYFNCGITALENYLKRNSIRKEKKKVGDIEKKVKSLKRKEKRNALLESINLESFKEDFNSNLLEVKDILNKYGLVIEDYNFLKNYLGLTSKTMPLYLNTRNFLSNFSPEYIKEYYQTHSMEECLKHFNVGKDAFLDSVHGLGIWKTSKIEDIAASVSEEKFRNELKRNLSVFELESIFNVSYWQLYALIDYFKIEEDEILINKKESENESLFRLLLEKNSISYETQFSLGNYKYDFKVGNTLIEIDPSYTHNSTFGYRKGCNPLPKNYHLQKSKMASQNGFYCIHIFDWDDPEKIINRFLPKEEINIDECEVREIDIPEARSFLDSYHPQGYTNSKIKLGLYYKEELIEIMSFSKPRYSKKHEWELTRLCAKPTCHIKEGKEKLFKFFRENYNPTNIIVYCDSSKISGSIYEDIGFKILRKGSPSRHWYNIDDKTHYTDAFLWSKGFDRLFHTNYGKSAHNGQLMIEYHFVEVYDCGQASYEWDKTQK